MSTPINIFNRTFALIFAEPGQTLKVISPGVIACTVAAILTGASVTGLDATDLAVPSVTNPLLFICALVIGAFGIIAFAVLWHRHALLTDDARAEVMRPSAGVFGQYLLGAIIIFGITFVASIPGGFVIGLLAAIFPQTASASYLIGVALGAMLGIFLSWIALRVSLILPAAAIGQKLKLSESWRATGTISRDVFWTAVLLGVLNFVIAELSGGIAAMLPGLSIAVGSIQIVIQSLIYVSVLSTLYGHLIQGRPLT
ncbi:hypothetical protein KX928_08490 [Roseobacter sp. YSTF-M11]|uniref:Uncharacterized protein n=1 Tax=Roseobacter insulae TaxID=2859783 RepID=A0A9X1JY53_9RHOB|nr:hypothetical protein [Roseobacter insulae]MBW4707820.1 hypothetical protein [Roseobacter insulae]